jgi:hypothetical protein
MVALFTLVNILNLQGVRKSQPQEGSPEGITPAARSFLLLGLILRCWTDCPLIQRLL